MGICLSCLYPAEEEYNEETSPLLASQVDESVVALKRNKELESIVTNTNELLIDITSFLNGAGDDGRDLSSVSNSGFLNSARQQQQQAVPEGETQVFNPQTLSREQRKVLADLHSKARKLVDESVAVDTSRVGALVADIS